MNDALWFQQPRRRRAADERNELAPPHVSVESIVLAKTSIPEGGRVRHLLPGDHHCPNRVHPRQSFGVSPTDGLLRTPPLQRGELARSAV